MFLIRLQVNDYLLSCRGIKSYMQIFDCMRGSVTLTPVSFKGQLYLAPKVHMASSGPLGALRGGAKRSLCPGGLWRTAPSSGVVASHLESVYFKLI